MSSAPLSAWSRMGPAGFHASSQMLTPTRTPPTDHSPVGSHPWAK